MGHMPTPDTNNQTPDVFLAGLKGDIERGVLPKKVEEVFFAAIRHLGIRSVIEANPDKIRAILEGSNPEALLEFLKIASSGLTPEESEAPVAALPEKQIIRQAQNFRDARESLEQLASQHEKKLASVQQQFRERLVETFVARSRLHIETLTEEQTRRLELVLDTYVKANPFPNESIENIQAYTKSAVNFALLEAGTSATPVLIESVLSEINTDAQKMVEASRNVQLLESAPTTLVDNAGSVSDLTFLVKSIESKLEQGVENPIEDARFLARTNDALQLTPEQAGRLVQLEATLAETFKRAGMKGAADAISGLTKEAQEAVVKAVFAQSMERAVAEITRKLGGEVAKNLEPFIQHANQVFSQTGQVGNLADVARDLAGHLRGVDKKMVLYLELIQTGTITHNQASTIGLQHFVIATIHTDQPSAFNLVFDMARGRALEWAVRTGAAKVAGGAAGAATKSGIMRFLTGLFGASGARAAGAAAAGTVFGGPIGTIIGGILGFIGGSLIGPMWKGFKNLFGGGKLGAVTDAIKDMVGGSSSSQKDKSGLAIAAFVGIAVFVVMFGSGFQILDYQGSNFAMNATGGGITSEGQTCDATKDPECAVAHCDPAKQDCSWPTPNGCITQGPFSAEGNTHGSLNAIDIGFGGGLTHVDVTATHDGVVVEVESGYGENDFVPRSYGNYVLLRGTAPNNIQFYTLYSHLWTIAARPDPSSGGLRLLTPGDTLKRGDPIGKTDNNGTSYGEHLHYEYREGGRIVTILPIADSYPGCKQKDDCSELVGYCW